MNRVAAVPMRSLQDGKRRLDLHDRAGLNTRLLENVLHALLHAGCFAQVAVISPDADVLRLATDAGAVALAQRSQGLNPACDEAVRWALAEGAQALMLAHADLPRLDPADVRGLIAAAKPRGACVVLGPDRHGSGTNLLYATPPDAIGFAFGVNSRFRHRALARRAGVPVVEYVCAGTSADIDTPDDLAESLGFTAPVVEVGRP